MVKYTHRTIKLRFYLINFYSIVFFFVSPLNRVFNNVSIISVVNVKKSSMQLCLHHYKVVETTTCRNNQWGCRFFETYHIWKAMKFFGQNPKCIFHHTPGPRRSVIENSLFRCKGSLWLRFHHTFFKGKGGVTYKIIGYLEIWVGCSWQLLIVRYFKGLCIYLLVHIVVFGKFQNRSPSQHPISISPKTTFRLFNI